LAQIGARYKMVEYIDGDGDYVNQVIENIAAELASAGVL
jgi:hypothetical protein